MMAEEPTDHSSNIAPESNSIGGTDAVGGSGQAPQRGDNQELPGYTTHEVQQGDCMSSIAHETGHHWGTLWGDSANSELRELREDPNVLFPGDRVAIRERVPKHEPGATEQLHRFRRLGEPVKFVLRMLKCDGTPRNHVPFELHIGSDSVSDRTDEEGKLYFFIPPGVHRGTLLFALGSVDGTEEYELEFGCLDPGSECDGAMKRLSNLGGLKENESIDDRECPEEAIKRFQAAHEIEPTGTLDPETEKKLEEEHGC